MTEYTRYMDDSKKLNMASYLSNFNNATAQHLEETIRTYYAARGYVWPDTQHAMNFAITEIGEALEYLLADGGFVRNNPRDKPTTNDWDGFSDELGDAIMMLMVAGMVIGKNPLQSLFDKMDRKLGK